MDENRKSFVKIWNVIVLRKCVGSDFDSCMRMFKKFVKKCSKHAKRKTYSSSILFNIRRKISLCNGSRVFGIKANKISDSSVKSWENLL